MITAVDSNVLLDVLNDRQEFGSVSSAALRRCTTEGALVASEVVWAEVSSFFVDTGEFEGSMDLLNVVFVPTDRAAAVAAGRAAKRYGARGGARDRVVADFLVGAHALHHADRLLTRDRGFYRGYFEGLQVLDPSA
jgi:predicted nucleic acid-binding protein